MRFRAYSAEQEGRAKDWAGVAQTTAKWTDLGPFGTTESRPFRVQRSDGFLGLAKPGEPRPDDAHAAHEKIASDLAYHLGLPIAPAVLWDRGDGPPTRHVCICAWAFDSCADWNAWHTQLTDDEKKAFSPTFSAMNVFETWLGADDRNKGDALLIGTGEGGALAISFFDFAFSMSKYWSAPNAPISKANSFMPSPAAWVEEAAKEMAGRIEALSDDLIDQLVMRVPDPYLSPLKKDVICANLKSRKAALKGALNL